MDFEENLKRLRADYGEAGGGAVRDPKFRKVAERIFDPKGTRVAPYAGIPTFLAAPIRADRLERRRISAICRWRCVGVPMDLGVTNRNGARFGPRALRTIERIGPYNHVLECAPVVRPEDRRHRRRAVPQPLQPRAVARGHRAARSA